MYNKVWEIYLHCTKCHCYLHKLVWPLFRKKSTGTNYKIRMLRCEGQKLWGERDFLQNSLLNLQSFKGLLPWYSCFPVGDTVSSTTCQHKHVDWKNFWPISQVKPQNWLVQSNKDFQNILTLQQNYQDISNGNPQIPLKGFVGNPTIFLLKRLGYKNSQRVISTTRSNKHCWLEDSSAMIWDWEEELQAFKTFCNTAPSSFSTPSSLSIPFHIPCTPAKLY